MQGQVIMEAKNVKQEGGTAELGRATRRHSHVSDQQAMKLIVPVFLSGSFRTPPFFFLINH
jgi:hypothetical protein